MLPVLVWLFRGLAVALGASHGYFLATTPTDWSEDSWREEIPYSVGTALDVSDESGMYRGCFSYFIYVLAWLRHGWRLYGCARVLAPVMAFSFAFVGWQPDWDMYREMGIRALFLWPVLLLGEAFFWATIGSVATGYIAGRLTHRGFFRDRTM